jgi:hypothetical protein
MIAMAERVSWGGDCQPPVTVDLHTRVIPRHAMKRLTHMQLGNGVGWN